MLNIQELQPRINEARTKGFTDDQIANMLSANDEDFARVWASLQEFRKGWKIWGDLGYVD